MFYETDADARSLSEMVFNQLDTDRGGFLCQDELGKARTFMVRRFGAELAEALQDETDANGDGQVDLEEWHSFCEGVYCLLGKKKFMEDLRLWTQSSEPDRPKTAPGTSRVAASSPFPESPRPKTSPGKAKATAKAKKKSNATSSEDAAATKLQSAHRGKKARQDVETKKGEKKAESNSTDFKPAKNTTIADLWEHMSLEGGSIRTTVPVGEVINLYADIRETGLDINLPKYVPMHFEDEELLPEELTVEEVAHICKCLLENLDLTEEGARQSLNQNRPFPADQDKRVYARMDGHFNLKRLKRFVSLTSALMRVDEQYTVLAMQYVILGVFELTDTLAALMIERCTKRIDDNSSAARRGPAEVFDKMPNEMVLQKAFHLDEFQRMMYFGAIVDDSGKMGIRYGDISLIFARAQKNMTKRLEARAERKKIKLPKSNASRAKDNVISGRAEFECLLEELHSITLVQSIFSTPMIMAVHFAHKAKQAQEAAEAEAAEASKA